MLILKICSLFEDAIKKQLSCTMGPPVGIGHVDCIRHQKNQMISDNNGKCNSAAQRKKPPKSKGIKDTNFKVGHQHMWWVWNYMTYFGRFLVTISSAKIWIGSITSREKRSVLSTHTFSKCQALQCRYRTIKTTSFIRGGGETHGQPFSEQQQRGEMAPRWSAVDLLECSPKE